jgi:hypothetical protein
LADSPAAASVPHQGLLDAHSVALDNVEGEDGISVRKNWKGGPNHFGQRPCIGVGQLLQLFQALRTPATNPMHDRGDGRRIRLDAAGRSDSLRRRLSHGTYLEIPRF